MTTEGNRTSQVNITASTFWPAFNLRMPADLKARLQKKAAENNRSLNAEINTRLRQTLEGYAR